MHESHEFYCLADRRFYATPANRGAQHPDFVIAGRAVPDGWRHVPGEQWMHYAPDNLRLPAQGWKIHVSASQAIPNNAISPISPDVIVL